ncbi:glycosyl transferase family group 2-domain-containing protein [Podospora aff. communis PSN243]|uniref:Glycosyl transferase family group 2-domain-containing protein n=1 Tax=Podospora aff. communis PSN243 TaxID=3040156 RepID=A0AAV9H2N4_9PEZI|nr:glycosyl transferase family group 2-domain-containing protein [Podospora aff. communis PSN243]
MKPFNNTLNSSPEDEDEKGTVRQPTPQGRTGRTLRRASRSEKGHPLQSLKPRGRSKGPAQDEHAVTDNESPPSVHGSTLSVPSAVDPRAQHRGLSPDGTSVKTARRSASASRHTPSIFPAGDERNNDADALNEVRSDMMVNWLYEQQLRKQYATGEDPFEGVVLKKSRGNFTCCPPHMAAIPDSLFAMVREMNVRCAMTVNTPVVRALLGSITQTNLGFVPLPDGLQVQILPTMDGLPRCQRHHFAAFIEDARLLVVWDDDPEKLLARVQNLEQRFIEIIWGKGDNEEDEEAVTDEKKAKVPMQSIHELDLTPEELEEALAKDTRPVKLMSAFMVALTMTLSITCLGLGWRALAYQCAVDGTYIRLALVAVGPVQFFLSMFFFQTIIGNFFQLFGPNSHMASNSKYYSGKPPPRLNRAHGELPHVTIQMPVYKEGLATVIKPTILSVKAAISTYEMQGGKANIFVNDDGMQLLSEEEQLARRDFYEEHNIGWVARPAHNSRAGPDEPLFVRRGKFKKASNMNYALNVSTRVEDKLEHVNRQNMRWSTQHENVAYQRCLIDVLTEDQGRTWAEGNIRVGDYILIIDSDTRVPSDCLLDAVSEMEYSPEVAIMQFSSGVMNVTDSYFENGVTWFTNLIYTAITFTVAAGDACPFVGHNAILRWSAIQDAAAYTDSDGYEKYWSESHVSEDFDMALRLQVAGYSLRFASYTGDGFKEGVSLTVYDELARWEKYAYGSSELLFHPVRFWLVRGPFTPLFRDFMTTTKIPLAKKMTICAYIGTYYAIGAAWILCLANYFITGWFYGLYDKYYLDSFAIYISIVVVFNGLGNLSLAVLRYRTHQSSLLRALVDNLKWVPMFTIFLGGISLHVSQALLCHMFEIDMVWGATAKEVEQVHFGQEVVRILKKFKWTFLYCIACSALMICGVYAFPIMWRINFFFSIYPLAVIVLSHFALPVLLNPALMMFTW